jgi:hypothetical protein
MEASYWKRIHEGKRKGVNNIMISFIEVFLLAAIFGVLYGMLQLASR